MKPTLCGPLAAVALLAAASPSYAMPHGGGMEIQSMDMMSTGIFVPEMDPARGRVLFAQKGCVVCHSINGVGGEDAQMLDAEFMDLPMNPFEFSARMWRGTPMMIAM